MGKEGPKAVAGEEKPAPVPVRADLFEFVSGEEIALSAARCGHCEKSFFPRLPLCPYCGGQRVEPLRLPSQAVVEWSTVVTAAPPGYSGPLPYGLGVVRSSGELRIIAPLLCSAPLAKGTPVRSVAWVVGQDEAGRDLVTYAFRPLAESLREPARVRAEEP